ncbi:MAG: alpha/beta hydrolase [Myxococcota bacterium]
MQTVCGAGRGLIPTCAAALLFLGAPGATEPVPRQDAQSSGTSLERGLVYARPGGRELRADVRRPAGDGPHPGVLVVHGGSWSRGSRSRMRGISERLAQAGYAAVSVDYRLAPQHRFPAQIHDCKAAVRWMRGNAGELRLDPDRIGGFGYSSGAHLVALLATTAPADGLEGVPAGEALSSRIQAAVLGGAPTDLRRFPPNTVVRRFLGGGPDELPSVYALASPITHVSADDSPIFLYHGTRDLVVDVSHARRMAEALREAGVPHQLREADFGHAATFLWDGDEVDDAIRFLDQWLGAQP